MRDLVLEVIVDGEALSVSYEKSNGEKGPLPRMDSVESSYGWMYVNGVVTIIGEDRFESTRFIITLGKLR